MTEIKLVSAMLAAPIERVRGGNIVVSMHCGFRVTNGETEDLLYVTGIASTSKDDLASIRAAHKEAIEDAKQNLALVGVVAGMSSRRSEVDTAIVHALANMDAEKAIKAKTDAGQTTVADKLAGPATDVLQKEIDQLLDTLGVQSIPILGQADGKEWTLGEAIALRMALNDKVKVFIPDDKSRGAYSEK